MLTSLWTGLGFLPPLPFSLSLFIFLLARRVIPPCLASLSLSLPPLHFSPRLGEERARPHVPKDFDFPSADVLAWSGLTSARTRTKNALWLGPRESPLSMANELATLIHGRPPRWIEKLISRVHRHANVRSFKYPVMDLHIWKLFLLFGGRVGEGSFLFPRGELKLVKIVF